MGKDFETVVVFNGSYDRASLFLDQLAKMATFVNSLIVSGFECPTSINPIELKDQVSDVDLVNTRDNDATWVAKRLDSRLYSIKVYSRTENIRSILRMCWHEPLVLIEEESSVDPDIVWLGNNTFTAAIPDDWAGFFDASLWVSEHIPLIRAAFDLNPYTDKQHPIAGSFGVLALSK